MFFYAKGIFVESNRVYYLVYETQQRDFSKVCTINHTSLNRNAVLFKLPHCLSYSPPIVTVNVISKSRVILLIVDLAYCSWVSGFDMNFLFPF
jgi:hypothetical protein